TEISGCVEAREEVSSNAGRNIHHAPRCRATTDTPSRSLAADATGGLADAVCDTIHDVFGIFGIVRLLAVLAGYGASIPRPSRARIVVVDLISRNLAYPRASHRDGGDWIRWVGQPILERLVLR